MKQITAQSFLLGLAFLLFSSQPAFAQGKAGTTLTATKTATGFWEHRVSYDWNLEKTADPTQLALEGEESQTVNYTLTATRTETENVTVAGAEGEICVTNGGDRATQNLMIMDQLQYKTGSGKFQNLGLPVLVSTADNPVLDPGESDCYPYEILFTPVSGATYRNTVKVTITNHSGSLGTAKGPEPKADFSLPGSPTEIITDDTASLSDILTCPDGYTCEPSVTGPWSLTASQTIDYSVLVTRTSAACNTEGIMTNVATLTEETTDTVRTDSATVTLSTEDCPDQGEDPEVACTYTQGYWKNHQENWPVSSLQLGTPSYDQAQLLSIFNQPVEGNGLVSLAHQLAAAKLNVAHGASTTDISTAIANADALIGSLIVPPVGSGVLSTEATSTLTSQLDAFNNGNAGIPHCE